MRRALTALLIAAASTSLAAQTSTAAAPSQAPANGSTVTVTGCLAKGDGANALVLTKVRWNSTGSSTTAQAGHHEHQQTPAPSTTPPLTTPSTPSTAPAESAAKKTADDALQRAGKTGSDRLRIAGNTPQMKLADYVGHTITATGMLAAADPVVTPGVVLPDPPAGKPAPKPSSDSQLRVLNIRSFTNVASDCK